MGHLLFNVLSALLDGRATKEKYCFSPTSSQTPEQGSPQNLDQHVTQKISQMTHNCKCVESEWTISIGKNVIKAYKTIQ